MLRGKDEKNFYTFLKIIIIISGFNKGFKRSEIILVRSLRVQYRGILYNADLLSTI